MKAIYYLQRITIISALLLPRLLLAQGTLTITFDGPPIQPTNSQYLIQSYFEAGFSFIPLSGSDGFLRNGGGLNPLDAYDGSAYLQAGYGEGLEFSNGGLFGLSSVDLAAYSINIPDYTVDFVGYLSNGSTISTSFSGTGIDFQTFDFGPEWSSGLTEVQIPNSPWSLDNLVVIVPEPGAGALFSIGAIAFLAYQFKRRKQV